MSLVNIIKGLSCGIIYVSSFFWSIVLTFIFNKGGILLIIPVILLTNIFIGWLMASFRYKQIFLKWLLSLPAGMLTFITYREIGFINYWVNRIIPGYGRLSAGNGFASLFYMLLYLLSFSIAILVSVCLTEKKSKQYDWSE